MTSIATNSLQPISQNHQSENSSSANEITSTKRTSHGGEASSPPVSSATTNCLSKKHLQECCQKRGLDKSWVEASCKSIDTKEATELLGYTAKSPGILIKGINGQYQFKPDKPWADKQGKKAPKYRTACRDEYDAILPKHPTMPIYWQDTEKLRQRCYQIDGHPMLLVTEGGFKAIASCSHNIPTIALLGVEMGLTPTKNDPQGKRYLVPELENFAKKGFGFILGFDCDTYTKKPVIEALIKLATQLEKFQVPVYILPKWNESEGKGIDDYIQKQGIEEFRKNLLAQTASFEQWKTEYGQDAFDNTPPKPDIIGAEIAEDYRDRWIYCDELKTWLAYSLETKGIWTIVSEQYLETEIDSILEARNIKGYGSNNYIKNIVGKLKRNLFIRKWNEKNSTEWLPFRNGVLELATNKLHEHSPGFRFTWQLPRDYTVVETGWQHIDNWLNEATQGNSEHKQLLICFAAAVLRGRNDLQKFLHLIGGGGSGKSTFTTLLTALIGESNTTTLNLPDLEDKHEIARIFGKRLVVFPDQDKAPKKMSNFKRLTGQDRLSGRRLFENGFEFVFQGLTVVTSNFPLFHTNLGSWLIRRVSMIPFEYQCPSHKKRDLMTEFEPELGAFTKYLLSISESEINSAFKDKTKQSLTPTVWESQIRSDALAAWVNDCIVKDNEAKAPIGSNSKEWRLDDEYDARRSTLYGSYSLYCQQSNRSAKSPQNFSAELLELVNRTLGWHAEKARVKIAGRTTRVIKGLRLRSVYDDDKLTIEEIIESDNRSDNRSDNLKLPLGKESDNGDNLFLLNKKDKSNFSSGCDNFATGTVEEEVINENLLNNYPQVVTPVSYQSQQEVEAVTPAVTEVVTEVVPSTWDNITPQIDCPGQSDVAMQRRINEVDWQSYPYDSRDTFTLQNRANKVKERLLGCSTNNELIALYAEGKISQREIDWLKSYLLTPAERQQLETVEATKQTNLFAQSARVSSPQDSAHRQQLMDEITEQVKRLGWNKKQGIKYIEQKYSCSCRNEMSIDQLIEFRDYLTQLS